MGKYDYNIVNKGGHWEVYIAGKFFCSADTLEEGIREAEKFYDENE